MGTKANQNKLIREERRKKVAANILAGMTYREIAEAIGAGLATIKRDRDYILGVWQKESVGEISQMIILENRRLDAALNSIMGMVLKGNFGAIDRMLAIMEKRMKLFGLDSKALFDNLKDLIAERGHDLTEPIGTVAEGIRELQTIFERGRKSEGTPDNPGVPPKLN